MAQTKQRQPSPSDRPERARTEPARTERGGPGTPGGGPQADSGIVQQDEFSEGGGVVRIAEFRHQRMREGGGIPDLSRPRSPQAATLWIDLTTPSQAQVENVAERLGLHELIVEDILEGNQRAKIELTDDAIHLVVFALTYGERVTTCEVDIVLGPGYLLTVHGTAWDPRSSHHLQEGLAGVMKRGPDHLLWALVDGIVDGYFPVLDRIGDEIDGLEDSVVNRATPTTLEQVFLLKKELLSVRRALAPVREIFNQLTNREVPLIDQEEVIYFRDVYDHLIRLTDELDVYREMVSGTLEVYLSQVNNNLSLIMKRLTGVTVVLAGIGAVAGIFGMSEAGTALTGQEAGGFWLVTAFTVAVASAAAILLRRIDWI